MARLWIWFGLLATLWLSLVLSACRTTLPDRPVSPRSGWLEKICPDPDNPVKIRTLKKESRLVCGHANRRGYPRWIFQASERIVSTPKPGIGDILYISSLDKKLYAIDSQGNRRWTFRTRDLVLASPATTIDGTAYIAAKNGLLYSIDRGGMSKWNPPFDTGSKIDSSPRISTEGTIFIATHNAKMYALDSDRSVKWIYRGSADFSRSTPEFSPDSLTLYIGNTDGYLHAVQTADNIPSDLSRRRWQLEICDKITASPAVGPDGTIYIGCWNGKLVAVAPNGRIKWSFRTGQAILATPKIGNNQTIYVGSDSTWFYAIQEGKCLWRFRSGIYRPGKPKVEDSTPDASGDETNIDTCAAQFPAADTTSHHIEKGSEAYIQASATVSSKNVIYFGSINEYLYAVSPEGKLEWSFDAQGWIDNAPVIKSHRSQEIVYVAAGSRLYAINP